MEVAHAWNVTLLPTKIVSFRADAAATFLSQSLILPETACPPQSGLALAQLNQIAGDYTTNEAMNRCVSLFGTPAVKHLSAFRFGLAEM